MNQYRGNEDCACIFNFYLKYKKLKLAGGGRQMLCISDLQTKHIRYWFSTHIVATCEIPKMQFYYCQFAEFKHLTVFK